MTSCRGRAALDNALSAADAFGLYGADALQTIDEIWTKVREWKVYFEEHGVPRKEIENIAPAFRHIDDVSSVALRKKLP
jgi:serine/threonine-protein kinase HipA